MNNILTQLDEFFKSQKDSEQKLFFFLPVLLFGFLSYYFVYPVTDEDLTKSISKEKSLNNQINQVSSSINRLKTENLKLVSILKQGEKTLKVLSENKKEVDNSLKKLNFLIFDMDKWATFYANIPLLAQKHNLNLIRLDNFINSSNPQETKDKLLTKSMSFQIIVNGNFIDFINFLHEFENKRELLKIRALFMDTKEMIVIIDVYGAKL